MKCKRLVVTRYTEQIVGLERNLTAVERMMNGEHGRSLVWFIR